MSAVRPMVARSGGVPAAYIEQGDLVIGGEVLTAGLLTTVGAGLLTAALIASGLITRSGPVGAFTDTTDTADAILDTLAGNSNGAIIENGSTFRLLYMNTVAQAMTLAGGTGVTLDTTNGSKVVNCAASLIREYLLTITNCSNAVTLQSNMNTAVPRSVLFNLPAGQSSLPLAGSSGPGGLTLSSGMLLVGTGITAGTKATGLIMGQGGIIGVTTDTDVASTQANSSILFSPTITISSLGTRGL